MLVDIVTAICLVLVIEGMLPFLSPRSYKAAVRSVLELPDRQLRIFGLSSMIAGILVLAIVR